MLEKAANLSSIGSYSLVNTGAVYFFASSILKSVHSIAKVSTNILNPFIAGVLCGMVYDKAHVEDIDMETTIQKSTNGIISSMTSRVQSSSSKIIKEIQYTYSKAREDILYKDEQLVDAEEQSQLIIDRQDPSAFGYTQRFIRQSILKQDSKSFAARTLQASNYLNIGIKSTIILTQRAYYNLGFIIGSSINKSFQFISPESGKQYLFYASSAFCGVNLIIQAALIPLNITVDFMRFIINAAIIGLMGFIIGKEYDHLRQEHKREDQSADVQKQSINDEKTQTQEIVNTAITYMTKAAPQTKNVIDKIYNTYSEYYKFTQEIDQELCQNSVDKFVRGKPLQTHNMLSLELKKLFLENKNTTKIQKIINHVIAANTAISMCLTKYAFDLGSNIRSIVQPHNQDKHSIMQHSIV